MRTFKDLNTEEKLNMYNTAHNFLHDHCEHVHSLFDKKTPAIAPSGSDMFKPELWKGIHWAWFVDFFSI